MPSKAPTNTEIMQAHINSLQGTINGLEQKITRMTAILIAGDERQKELENQLKTQKES
jgi:hypothetical protein